MMAPSPSPLHTVDMEVPSVIACRPSTPDPPELQFADSHSSMMDCDDTSVSSLHFSHSDIFRTPPRTPQQPHHYSQQSPQTPDYRNTQTVRVNVGGEDYAIPYSAFQRFLGLPWKVDNAGVFCLDNGSSAAVFEVLLDYTLFGTMPAYDTLSNDEFQEFETLALAMGGLTALIEHFDRKDSYLAKELRQRSPKRRGRHFLINPEDNCNRPSPNSVSATRVARFLGALCGVAESIAPRRTLKSSSGDSTSSTMSMDIHKKLGRLDTN